MTIFLHCITAICCWPFIKLFLWFDVTLNKYASLGVASLKFFHTISKFFSHSQNSRMRCTSTHKTCLIFFHSLGRAKLLEYFLLLCYFFTWAFTFVRIPHSNTSLNAITVSKHYRVDMLYVELIIAPLARLEPNLSTLTIYGEPKLLKNRSACIPMNIIVKFSPKNINKDDWYLTVSFILLCVNPPTPIQTFVIMFKFVSLWIPIDRF